MGSKVPSVTFNDGQRFPILGLGTWMSKRGEVAQAVKYAIDAGYRHIDCALIYLNEKEVGEGISEKISEGVVKREDLYLTSKLWNTFHRPELVVPALKRTLNDLRVKYLDLYLIHWPMGYKEGDDLIPKDENRKTLYNDSNFIDIWPKLEQCVKDGLVKSIGVSNFNSQQIDILLSIAQIKPVVNQVECHPYLNQKQLQEFCNSKGIILVAHSPLGSPNTLWAKPGDLRLLDDPRLKAIAEKYAKSPAQILIRYQIQRGNIVIPKSVSKSRIESNLEVFDFELAADDVADIDSFDCNLRQCHFKWVEDHKDYPFNIDF